MRPIPVTVLTGFLGAGKTSFLNRLLADPALADTAVIINEFGAVGLDHLLVETSGEGVTLLAAGCLCCTIRGELADTMLSLADRREAGTLPPFRRLIIETTGLADPTPILATVMNHPVIRHHFRLGNIVTTVDAVNGETHLDRQPESAKQAAIADRILVTKVDLTDEKAVRRLEARLARINPVAPKFRSANAALPAALLVGEDVFEPASKAAEVRRWLAEEARHDHGNHDHREHHHRHHRDPNRHDARIHSFAMTFDGPVDWTVFGIWLTLLLDAHGADVLRVKGILNLGEGTPPVVVNGVQHLVHPPLHLDHWPDDDRRSRLVFIVRDIPRVAIEASFAAFQRALAREAVAA
jgi:G3E family GTPase